jgi:phosphatidylglycerophosphate synthase
MPEVQSVKSTYKAKDTEEIIDKIFYRPIGFVMAIASKALGLSPNAVTIISIFVGVAAGHFFYYESISLNLYGIILLILANAMDSADGQLARITNNKSRIGRILDGLAGNLWFISIYMHLYFRLINNSYNPFVLLLLIIAGISHSFQSAYADYFRNYYLMFVHGKDKSEIEESVNIKEKYNKLSWVKDFTEKFLLRVYLNYTLEQELFSKDSIKLYNLAKNNFDNKIPVTVSSLYKKLNKPLIKYFNILTTNTRMIFLFIVLFLKEPVLYFLFELTILNILFVYMVLKHEKNSSNIYDEAVKVSIR